jgi:hypothetical protein
LIIGPEALKHPRQILSSSIAQARLVKTSKRPQSIWLIMINTLTNERRNLLLTILSGVDDLPGQVLFEESAIGGDSFLRNVDLRRIFQPAIT